MNPQSTQSVDLRSNEAAATAAVAQVWGTPAAELQSVSMASTFPWCKRFTPFLVVDKRRHRAASASDGESVLCFATDPRTQIGAAMTAKIQALNALLDAEKIVLPRDLSAVRLAEAARACLREPGGFVATRELYETLSTPRPGKTKLPIDAWLYVPPPVPGVREAPTTTAEQRRAMFEAHAIDPVFADEGDAWRLKFNFFTLAGGVETWELTGRPESGITSATVTEALPTGTFTPPFG
jgi:hypothetical protein